LQAIEHVSLALACLFPSMLQARNQLREKRLIRILKLKQLDEVEKSKWPPEAMEVGKEVRKDVAFMQNSGLLTWKLKNLIFEPDEKDPKLYHDNNTPG
jgi:hypothetical protein